jgi:hypothetical protein
MRLFQSNPPPETDTLPNRITKHLEQASSKATEIQFFRYAVAGLEAFL